MMKTSVYNAIAASYKECFFVGYYSQGKASIIATIAVEEAE